MMGQVTGDDDYDDFDVARVAGGNCRRSNARKPVGIDLTFDADANTNGGSIFRECTSSSSLLPPSPAHW